MKQSRLSCLIVVWLGLFSFTMAAPLEVTSFEVDVTPSIGTPVAYAPTRSVDDPISARGIVLTGAGDPIVLCAVDYLGIGNTGYEVWRETLAKAAQTTPQRVAVHTLHQHDGPRCDFSVEQLLAHHGMGGKKFDVAYCRDVLRRTGKAVTSSLMHKKSVTHIGLGRGKVDRVASNRRVLGTDGKVRLVRWSRSRDPAAMAAPEGLIDPWVRSISFWYEDQPVVVLTYYATHPQSYYGQGDVTCEFVGMARNQRQSEIGGVVHVHFNGAGGNITAGKYNDGDPANRPVLADRLRRGMQLAWQATDRHPVTAADIEWRVVPVALPVPDYMQADRYREILESDEASQRDKLMAAKGLVWLTRCQAGYQVELTCLRLGGARILHLPGELFVEYQLVAQAMAPDALVAVAAYGDYGPGYIGTEIAYSQGGYEVRQDVSRVAPQVEHVLHQGMRELLQP